MIQKKRVFDNLQNAVAHLQSHGKDVSTDAERFQIMARQFCSIQENGRRYTEISRDLFYVYHGIGLHSLPKEMSFLHENIEVVQNAYQMH